MIQSIIHRILQRRHFWRYATFGEVAELYASRTLRMFALRMITTFTSIFLFQQGYSLVFIAFFFAVFYFIKVPFAILAAKFAARFGPKHGVLLSNIISAFAMILLALEPHFGVYALVAWCVLQAFSSCIYDLCYLIDFSKVKHSEHAGKEIGFMNILDKLAGSISPVVGGLLALLYGPETIMVLSAVLFLLAAWPLFKTGEPTRTNQKLEIRGFPWRTTWRGFVADAGVGFDVLATSLAWNLFMVVIVFAGDGNEIYAKVGVLTSFTVIVALASSYSFGRIIDKRRGGELLRMSVIANSFTHLARPFITTPVGVVLTNTINEGATTGYSMAFTRGMFDTADLSGRRIVYLLFMEMAVNFGAAVGAILLGLFFMLMGGEIGLKIFFVASAIIVLIIGAPRFMLYRR